MIVSYLIEMFVGLAGGLAVGSGFVAFISVLGIIPRLVQLSKSKRFLRAYEWAVILGALFGIYLSFTSISVHIPIAIEMFWGLLHGIFIGMLAAALTEVLNVFPILAKRIKLEYKIELLVLAIVFGKIMGSIFQWVIYVR
ncbi:stage V sporulation protein AB [Tenuibacillus multivorans]|uniref:Stage V sporulation protein AB n=1 Tax=Tenuibacillus multivorans TaxID=237069 RepID=A0A1H0CZ98_9BACI|nr:stage V sporulation protein AB [Tenuibacillus multivorans]GEL76105.1 stage V sporulation protein AB [Tenuibacillus multivorans]SDN63237.1 stage V sporulation protein AB [Tenuibacillus multivorans]